MPTYYPNVSGQRIDLGGQEQFDPASGETPESEGAAFSDTRPTMVTPMTIGPTDLSDVITPNDCRLHTDASYRPNDGRYNSTPYLDPYVTRPAAAPDLPPKSGLGRAVMPVVKSPSGSPSKNSNRTSNRKKA